MSNKLCIHCYVSGKVQGVWYRASTEEQATRLGITGWVKNLPDGRVEVFACGERETLAQLFEWLKLGPQLAHVTAVTYEEMGWREIEGFTTL